MSQETMNTILTAVIVPLLVALVPFVAIYLNKLADEAKGRTKDQQLHKYIDIAEDAIESSVVAVTQTYVDAIKGGEGWTKEAQQQAFTEAKKQALLIMGSAARLAIKEAYGDFDRWLESSIEYYVNKNKTTTFAFYKSRSCGNDLICGPRE